MPSPCIRGGAAACADALSQCTDSDASRTREAEPGTQPAAAPLSFGVHGRPRAQRKANEAGTCVFAARRQLCKRSPHICVCIPLGLHQLAGALDVHIAISRGACHPAGTQPGGRCAGKRALWNSSRCRAAGACWAHSRGCKRALCLAASWTTRRQRARVGKLETRQLSSAGSKAMVPPQTEVSLGPLRG